LKVLNDPRLTFNKIDKRGNEPAHCSPSGDVLPLSYSGAAQSRSQKIICKNKQRNLCRKLPPTPEVW